MQHIIGGVGLAGDELADRLSIHGMEKKEKVVARFVASMALEEILAMRNG